MADSNFKPLMDALEARNIGNLIGYNSLSLILKLTDGEIVEMTGFEPDANTFRGQYYYNTIQNKLFKKIRTCNIGYGWIVVSE